MPAEVAGRNQIEGAVVMGIGMALLEETIYDPRNGAPINANLADYAVAVNADVPPLEVHFLDYPDTEINALGALGIGEIGLAGMAAAINRGRPPCDQRPRPGAAGQDRGLDLRGISPPWRAEVGLGRPCWP